MSENIERHPRLKCELYNDSYQNWKSHTVQPAQLIIADLPYCVGNNFYGSNPMWYVGGDNKNGESKKAGRSAFSSDYDFNLYEYFSFCHKLLKKEPKGKIKQRGRSSDAYVDCGYIAQEMKAINPNFAMALQSKDAARMLGMNHNTVRKGLQQGVFPWGYAVHTSEGRWGYFINAKKFAEVEGVTQ